ncbi:Uncharacterised protein [Mycobacteroides abscessus subsp. abscessus]|nr:Uncharacterised protein [Mycobacteroides abscessus subsp. abscessus]
MGVILECASASLRMSARFFLNAIRALDNPIDSPFRRLPGCTGNHTQPPNTRSLGNAGGIGPRSSQHLAVPLRRRGTDRAHDLTGRRFLTLG